MKLELTQIAVIHTEFPTKFGIPRQSGLVDALHGQIVFEPPYRNPDAFRGLEAYTYLWLLWGFSEAVRDTWSPTVRPPRLGGNTRMGVFATRSPFRPNPIGLSSVRLQRLELDAQLGPVLHVSGADLMDQTPIFDIKPYLSFTDSHTDSTDGFAAAVQENALEVVIPPQCLFGIPEAQRPALYAVLAQDPRPAYQRDPARIYGFLFAGWEIRFTVQEQCLTVCEVIAAPENGRPEKGHSINA